jgi:hypothetical protein
MLKKLTYYVITFYGTFSGIMTEKITRTIKNKIFKKCLRASTHYALFGCSLVFSCFHVLLVVYSSRINFFLFSTQTLQLTKT